jgi:Amt family ammonium transporter
MQHRRQDRHSVAWHHRDWGFVFAASSIVWMGIKMIMGVPPSDDDEALGLDRAECGMEAYPEFGRESQTI